MIFYQVTMSSKWIILKKNATVIYDVVSLRIKILSEDFPNSFAFSLIAFSPIVV